MFYIVKVSDGDVHAGVWQRHAYGQRGLVRVAGAQLSEHARAARPHLAVFHQHHRVARAAAHAQHLIHSCQTCIKYINDCFI